MKRIILNDRLTFKCPQCGCLFEADEGDFYFSEDDKITACPKCKHAVYRYRNCRQI